MMIFKNFEFRQSKNANGMTLSSQYELVKWSDDHDSCLVVGWIEYNLKESNWNFKGYGLRYQQYYEDGLNEFVLKYVDLLDLQIKYFKKDMEEYFEEY